MYVFEAEKMGKHKELSEYDRAKLKWLDNWVRATSKPQLFWDVPGLQWSWATNSGPRKEIQQTGDIIDALGE